VFGSAHHEIESFAPIRHCRFGAVSLGHLGRVRLDPVTAILAPDDQRQMRLCGAAELARRARVSPTTLANCERGSGIPRAQTTALERIRQTLEAAGVEFLGNGPGVRFRRRP